jgi:uncharacterized protein (DUF2147 family)
MKHLLAAAVLTLASAVPALADDPVWGIWQTEVDDGSYAYVEMAGCSGGKTCGWIRRTFDSSGEYQSPNLGKVMVINMENQGDGTYHGNVWRPSNDKTYSGKMELHGNTLSLAGCVIGRFGCAGQTWTRVE